MTDTKSPAGILLAGDFLFWDKKIASSEFYFI
jgi:hypothetical protein